MTPETLAANANTALIASMVVFALAMLSFAGHLATRAPRRAAVREDVLVGAAAGYDAAAGIALPVRPEGIAGSAGPTPAADAPDAAEEALRSDQGAARSRQWGAVGLNLTYVATLLLVSAVVLRGLAVSRPPWGNMYEFATAAAAAVAVTFSLLARRNRWEWLGVFIVTPVLLVLGLSISVLYTEAGQLMPALRSYWLGIHVLVAFIAVALFTIAAAINVLFLVRARREHNPPAKPSFIESLPPSAKLEPTAYGLNMVGFVLWTFTVIAGAIWAKEAWGAYWQWDPKEVWTFVIWTVYAAYMHSRATAGVDHRKSMYIALVGYVSVIINFTLVNLVSTFVGMHNYSGM